VRRRVELSETARWSILGAAQRFRRSDDERRKVNHFTRHPPGTESPLDTAGVNAKVRDLMAPVLGAQKTEALINQINTLETLDDIRKLRPLLIA
jgi:hypothetical protein